MRKTQVSLSGLLLALGACGLPACGANEVVPDAATSPDSATGGVADAAFPDGATITCEPALTRTVPGDDPIELGGYCNEITVCVEDQAEADAVEAAAPGFECGGTTQGTCGDDILCLHPGGDVTQEVLEEVCALTLLAEPPDEVVCWVFV